MSNRINRSKSGYQGRVFSSCVISRRELLRRMTLAAALAAGYPENLLAGLRQAKAAQPAAHADAEWMQQVEWKTIAQVQEVLFPATEEVPGAADFGALNYLYRAIENPQADGEDRDFIFRGVGWLNDLTQQRHNKAFLQLSPQQQQQTIEVIVTSRAGRNWISTLLSYLLEAMLSDPVYGGNTEGMGWKWLQHQPGFPAPPTDKTWYRLLRRRYG